MRIRKRSGQLGLPSSSSSISTTSTILSHSSDPPLVSTRKHEEERKRLDPCFGDEHQVHQTSKMSSSSDLELTFVRGNNGYWVCCSDDGGGLVEEKDVCMMMNTNPSHKMVEMNKELKLEEKDVCMMMNTNPTHKMVELKGVEEDQEMMIRTSSTTAKNRKSNSLGGDQEEVNHFGSGVPPCSSNISSHDDPHQVVLLHEMWCEGVLKGFPMKKRRGSNCERKVLLGDEEIMNKQKKIMKTATNPNKKWVVLHEKHNQELTDSTSSAKKNEAGSRCSRINGRGWRCCQQPLEGYSLCEHHSWKGRLMRSMNGTVCDRSSTTADVAKPVMSPETRVSLEKCHEDEEDYDDDDEEKTSTTTMMRIENKKRKKTGMVKARSISSLLGQTQVHA